MRIDWGVVVACLVLAVVVFAIVVALEREQPTPDRIDPPAYTVLSPVPPDDGG